MDQNDQQPSAPQGEDEALQQDQVDDTLAAAEPGAPLDAGYPEGHEYIAEANSGFEDGQNDLQQPYNGDYNGQLEGQNEEGQEQMPQVDQ